MRFKLFEAFTIDQAFKKAHDIIDKKSLKPLSTVVGKKDMPTKEELEQAADILDLDIENFFYDPNSFTHFIYWKGPIFIEIPIFSTDIIKSMKGRLDQKRKALSNKNFIKVFSMLNKKVAIPTFIEMYDQIPDDQKYDAFVYIYTTSEYGFSMFPKKIIKDLFSKRKMSSEWKSRMDKFKKETKLNPDGTLTIYRGEGSQSNNNGLSWSTDKETADFFANRFGKGKVTTKNIHPDEVIDAFDAENEVIIEPKDFLKENRVFMFEDFVNEPEPVGLAILGSPAGGKSYAKKLITHITKLVNVARAADPAIGMDLTVDIIRGKILDLPASEQLTLFYMAFYTLKDLSEEGADYKKWFSDIKDVWSNKISKQTDLDIKVSDDDLKINGKVQDEALEELKKADAEKIIDSLDKYQDYKRIVRAYQQIKQKEALGTKKDVVYDEVGDEPEKIINNMKKLHDKDYVTDVIMIHHDEVSNNIMQNASRMILGADGGRDSSESIIDAYSTIDANLDKYKKNAEVVVNTTNKELQKGEGDAPDALAAATAKDNDEKGNKAIDVFIRTKGDKPKEVYDRILKDLNDEQKEVFKSLLKYQIAALNIPEKPERTLSELIGDISNAQALQTLQDANAGKLKDNYVFKFGGISDNLIKKAKELLK